MTQTPTMPRHAVGIDVSKDTLDVAVVPSGQAFQVANDTVGWTQLITQVGMPTCVILEATNTYHLGAMLALDAAGLPVTLVNPARTHAFAKSEGIRTKTDRHDAQLLARFGQQKQPNRTPVPSATMRELTALVRARTDLTDALVVAKNQQHSATLPRVEAVHQDHIAHLDAQRRQLDQEITDLIATDPVLAHRRALLETVPGIGATLSAALVAELPELGLVDRRAAASLAGVAPFPRDSGKTQQHRMCVGGRRQVTTLLYQMAVTTTRWDPTMHAHDQQLRARRPVKVARIACARRMLGILTAMLRDNLTWQETRVGQGEFLPEAA